MEDRDEFEGFERKELQTSRTKIDEKNMINPHARKRENIESEEVNDLRFGDELEGGGWSVDAVLLRWPVV